MTLTGMALRNLTHRPWRTGLTLLGVMLAIAAYVALVGLARGIEGTLLEGFETRGTDVVLTEAGAADILSSVIPEALAADVATVEGVAAAAPELGRMTTLGDSATSFVVGWPPGAYGFDTFELVAGRLPLPSDRTDTTAGGIVLGERLAARIGVAPGDAIMAFAAPLTVTGTYAAEGLMAQNGAVMLLADMQAQTYRDGQATSVVVRLEDDLDQAGRDAVLETLRARFPDMAVEASDAMVQEYFNVKIAGILAWVVSTVAVISGALAVLNTMAMAVNERRGEIAIMGAVGWPRSRVIGVMMLEGACLTVTGSALGILAGIAAAWAVAHAPEVEGFVAPVVDLSLIARAMLLGAGIGLLGAWIPATRAAAQDPATILRGK